MSSTIDTIIGNAVLALIETGLNEHAHFWTDEWRLIKDDELEAALKDKTIKERIIAHISVPVFEKLQKALEARKKDGADE